MKKLMLKFQFTFQKNGHLTQIQPEFLQVLLKQFENPVFDFKLRWEGNNILFWEEHYFMMMAQLRRLRLVIPMDFTLDFFIKEIKKLINIENEKYLIIHLKFSLKKAKYHFFLVHFLNHISNIISTYH